MWMLNMNTETKFSQYSRSGYDFVTTMNTNVKNFRLGF